MSYQCWGTKKCTPSALFLEALLLSDYPTLKKWLHKLKNNQVKRKEYRNILQVKDPESNDALIICLQHHINASFDRPHSDIPCYRLQIFTTQKFPKLCFPFTIISSTITETVSQYYFSILDEEPLEFIEILKSLPQVKSIRCKVLLNKGFYVFLFKELIKVGFDPKKTNDHGGNIQNILLTAESRISMDMKHTILLLI